METKSSSHSRPLRPSYVHPDTASVNRKLDMVESLFGSVPASATLEEARDERLNGSCINRNLRRRVMIIAVDKTSLSEAATVHSISWKKSHCSFCSASFIEQHTPERQREYLERKMNVGSKIFMLVEEMPIGIVSVTDSLIEDLYILPDKQNMGYGTKLLQFAVSQCTGTPTLWILENNINAERLYLRMGFEKTGRKNTISNGLDEIEFALT